VNEEGDARTLRAAGVEAICTDALPTLAPVRGERSPTGDAVP
jgi:hypothetical protein